MNSQEPDKADSSYDDDQLDEEQVEGQTSLSELTGKLLGPYRLLEMIGRDPFGEIHRATREGDNRVWCARVLARDLAESEDYMRRLRWRVEKAVQGASGFAVRVLEEVEADGHRLVVTEYQVGRTLERWLQEHVYMEMPRSLKHARELLAALGNLHRAGLVHAHLSPSNVILSSTGLALVGGAELPEPVWGMEDASGTEHPPLVDGFRYIAPERYEGVSATPASDLYSLGCVLYHAVTGSAPFLGEDPSEVINMHLESEPTAPDKINARLPTPLCDLILCLMNKRPEQRFESAQKALASLAEVEPRQIGPSSVEAAQTAGSALQAFGTARIPDAAGAAAGEAEDLVQLSEEDVVGEAESASDAEEESLSAHEGLDPESSQIPDVSASSIPEVEPEEPMEEAGKPRRRNLPMMLTLNGIMVLVALALGLHLIIRDRPWWLPTPTIRKLKLLPECLRYEGPSLVRSPDGAEMVKVDEGEFAMGTNRSSPDEAPRQKIHLSRFYIDRCEVTNRQYRKFCQACGWPEPVGVAYADNKRIDDFHPWKSEKYASGDLPVVCVNYDDAKEYTRWLNSFLPAGSDWEADLPTEAEWEKAAAGEHGMPYPWGRTSLRELVVMGGAEEDVTQPEPVTSLPEAQSPYGLFHCLGNVAEWCRDWYHPSTYSRRAPGSVKNIAAVNPTGPDTGSGRCVRGRGWADSAGRARCQARDSVDPAIRRDDLGFRCVIRLKPEARTNVPETGRSD